MSQRPASEQYLKDATPTTVYVAPSPDQSALKASQIRPKSEILAEHKISSPEAEALEKWFQDLTQYERTLEEMAKASLEPSFKEELGAVENWFSALSEAERTAALYSLIHQSTNVQIRFFITVLQKMTNDPADMASPALSKQGLQTLNDGLLNRRKTNERNSLQLSHAESSNFFAAKSPTISRLSTNRISQINDSKLKSSSGDSIDLRNSSWERTSNLARFSTGSVRNKKIPNIDVTAATNWGKDDLGDSDRPKTASWHSNTVYLDSPGNRPRSATHNGDPNWGNLNSDKGLNSAKGRNPNNLTLKVDNVEIKLDSPHWPTSGRNLPLKSPAAPPGLYPVMSPISWAATPTEPIHQIRSPRPTEAKLTQVQPQSVPEEGPKEPKPLDPVDFEVLESKQPANIVFDHLGIPAWMRSLRLHKYTALFESMTWREVINLDDEKLTELGVSALGARRKFLKVFEHVKNEAQAKNIPLTI